MKLGFVSALFADLPFADVMQIAKEEGYGCVEMLCWPPGQAERRYAGVTHIDVTDLTGETIRHIHDVVTKTGVSISALGYYPNPLDPDPEHRKLVGEHIKKVIDAAVTLELGVVNTFIGRDHTQNMEAQWPLVRQVWRDIMQHADQANIRIGIENCPMLYSDDEWPGGKNLAISPATWRRLFDEVPSSNLGLNYDPSHPIWLQIDYVRCIRDFRDRIFHFHAKDTVVDREKLYEEGILAFGWHRDKIPGLGEVDWGAVFCALTDIGYNGPVVVEVEDRAFESSLEDRRRALRQSRQFLQQYVT